METKSPLDDYRTVNEAAEFLRSSTYMVRKLHKDGRLDMVQFGKRHFVSEESLQRLVKEGIKPIQPKTEKQ
jgi:hypothetical protein